MMLLCNRTQNRILLEMLVRSCEDNARSDCSTRQKKIAGLKTLDVYALAFYVDERGVRNLLDSKLKSQSEEDAVKGRQLYSGLFFCIVDAFLCDINIDYV